MDGLVSKGNKFPITILKHISPNKKLFVINFINILKLLVSIHDHNECNYIKVYDVYQ